MTEILPARRSQIRSEQPSNDVLNQLNIRYRVCHVFTPAENTVKNHSNQNTCQCGRKRNEHDDPSENEHEDPSKWIPQRNTLERINPAHGANENGSLYVRLDMNTPLEKVEKILLDVWKLPKPRFIVSIIGGTKYFKLNDRLETNFINGIVDIAQKSNAWLLTNGYNNGIVQLVGQAVYKVKLIRPDQKLTAIGICQWGCIHGPYFKTNSNDEENEETETSAPLNEMRSHGNRFRDVDPNHSHFLMLDDGSCELDQTKDYRTRLVTHMGRLQHDDDVTIPVVTVIVEGGKKTIENVYYDLRENIPVVIINGSGRAADFLNRWLLYTKDHNFSGYEGVYGINESRETQDGNPSSSSRGNHIDHGLNLLEGMFAPYNDRIKEDLKTVVLDDPKDQGIDQLVRQVMFCLQPAIRSNITVFNLNSDSDLSETIFRSICQLSQQLSKRREDERNDEAELTQRRLRITTTPGQTNRKLKARSLITENDRKAERSRLLDLAMDWNCVDIAKEFVFKNSLTNIMHKHQTFRSALQKNRPTFVYEFLQLGIDLYEVFITTTTDVSLQLNQYKLFIQTLYNDEAVNNGRNHLRYFIEVDKDVQIIRIENIETLNNVFAKLIGDYMQKIYFNTWERKKINRIKHALQRENDKELSPDQKKEMMHEYFLRDLFLWAIVVNQPDMAKVFLSHMKYRICPALIATKMFKQYHQKAAYGDLRKSYEASIEYFEKYAIDCLEYCNDDDPEKASEIILQRNELYGYVTCLQVAADANDQAFIATPACVQAVNNIWYNKLHPDQSSFAHKVALFIGFITLGLMAPFFVSYRQAKKEVHKIDRSKRRVKSNGINYCELAELEYAVPPSSEPAWKRYPVKWYKFQQSIPMKFFYHFITYLFFLLLFSYVLLFKFDPPTVNTPSIDWTEILTIILVTCMLIEEISYFFRQPNLTFFGKLINYFTQLFKILTALGFILFYIGLIVRFTYANSQVDFTAARIIMALDVEIWWLRSLSFIIIFPLLGPHLVSIGKMLKDLLFFMCIIAVVMIGYGVSTRSMAYYPEDNAVVTRGNYSVDARFDGRSVFRQIIYPVYYLMYGEFGEEMKNLDSNPDAGWSIATYVLLSIHMMLVNILLINLLIALFSKRFEEVYEKTKSIWHSQNYAVTREYYMRAPFFLPFSLIYDICSLCRMFFYYVRRTCTKRPGDYGAKVFQIIPEENSSIMKQWWEFEENLTSEYAHNEVRNLKNASIKSVAKNDSKSKENEQAKANIDLNNNTTIDGLKQIEDELLNFHSMIDKMSDRLEKKIKKHKSN